MQHLILFLNDKLIIDFILKSLKTSKQLRHEFVYLSNANKNYELRDTIIYFNEKDYIQIDKYMNIKYITLKNVRLDFFDKKVNIDLISNVKDYVINIINMETIKEAKQIQELESNKAICNINKLESKQSKKVAITILQTLIKSFKTLKTRDYKYKLDKRQTLVIFAKERSPLISEIKEFLWNALSPLP